MLYKREPSFKYLVAQKAIDRHDKETIINFEYMCEVSLAVGWWFSPCTPVSSTISMKYC